MFKNMKLALKIGLGFGLLLAISMSIGGLAIFQMSGVSTKATMLEAEYVPEVEIVNNVERYSLTTMYNMLGYALAEDSKYWDDANKNLLEVNKNLSAAQALADKSPHLIKLKESVKSAKDGVTEYEKLANQTKEKITAMNANRVSMNTAAGDFMKNSSDYSLSQNNSMKTELKSFEAELNQLNVKITLANDVIDTGNAVRVSVWKGIAKKDAKLIQDAIPNFDIISKKLDEFKKNTEDLAQAQLVDKVRSNGDAYKSAMATLVTQAGLQNGDISSLTELLNQMTVNAETYMKTCADLLVLVREEMAKDTKDTLLSFDQRLVKINSAKDVLELGYNIRIAAWKSQAERDPKIIADVQKNFEDITAELDKVKAITNQEINLKQIEMVRANSMAYKTSLNDLVLNWTALQDVGTKRLAAANVVLASAKDTAIAGVQETSAIAKDTVKTLSMASNVLITGLLVALVLGIIITIVITNSIVGPVKRGVLFAQIVSEGDLTQKIDVDQKDEIGQLADALNKMVTKTADVLSAIQQSSDQVAASSEQLSASAQNMASGATEQAASLEETTASIEQLSASIQQNANNAQSTNTIAQSTAASMDTIATLTIESKTICDDTVVLAQQGGSTVESMIKSMNQIASYSKKIGDIITVINEIADQTNLLALNAAIEAARAGEMGKGFAVVAVEVRKLAERSQLASKEITQMISESIHQIEGGVVLAGESGKSLEKIVTGMNQVSGSIQLVTDSSQQQLGRIRETAKLVQEIASFCEEQSAGVEQINKAMVQLDQVTQENSATSEESASASEELSAQAVALQEMVSRFKLSNHQKNDSYNHAIPSKSPLTVKTFPGKKDAYRAIPHHLLAHKSEPSDGFRAMDGDSI